MAINTDDSDNSSVESSEEHENEYLMDMLGQSEEFEDRVDTMIDGELDQLGPLTEVERATLRRELVYDICPPGHILRVKSLHDLGAALLGRFMESGDREDLEKAVLMYEQALEILPSDHDRYTLLLNNLANAILTQFGETGNPADLGRAIKLYEQALELYPPDHSDRSMSLNNLASATLKLFEQSGDPSDLDKSVSLHEQALILHSPGHPNHAVSLNGLANAVIKRYDQLGNRHDLDKAILLHQQALELRPPGHPHHMTSLNNLANSLSTRSEQTGCRTDLDRALPLYEQALELHPSGHPHRSTSLNNLANAFLALFRQSGSRADLDTAILLHEQALELRPLGHLERSGSLSNVATATLFRFDQSGKRDDVDRAVSLHEKALDLHQPGQPQYSTSLNNFAGALLARFNRLGNRADLERAVSLHEQGLQSRSSDHPEHSKSLSNLGSMLKIRFVEFNNHEDLDRAVLLLEKALEYRPPGHPNRSIVLYHLIDALLTRFEQFEDSTDLERALHWCHHALDIIPETDIYHTDLVSVTGSVYAAGYRSNDLPYDVEKILDALSRGSQSQYALLPARFKAAGTWLLAAIILDQPESAVVACRVCITLLPQLLWLELDLESRLSALKRVAGLINHGAACAARYSTLIEFVEISEGGRGVFWRHTHHLRMPSTDIPESFVKKFNDLANALRAASLEDSSTERSLSATESAAETLRRRGLVERWSQMLNDIRSTTGSDRFLLPRPFKELKEAAQCGPVIILNASAVLNCDAVIIKSPYSPPAHIALPNMTFSNLERLRAGLKRRLGYGRAKHADPVNPDLGDKTEFVDPQPGDKTRYMESVDPEPGPDFSEILEELWASVAKPIIDFLGLKKSDRPDRLWWCPTGLFAFMPIHAAGIYKTNESACVAEYAVSSYIPTLDALITARSQAAPVQTDKVLVVIQPKTPGLKPLPYTVEERKRIEGIVPCKAFLPLSNSHGSNLNQSAANGSDATVENVLSKLQEASIVHFACHGAQKKDPLKSCFYLQDKPLTMNRIIERELPNASIAILHTCLSAAGDEEQPDEAAHWGGTMLAAGYQSVIATMWYIEDMDGPLVAEEVYTRLFESRPDPSHVAYALHSAVRKLRDTGADFASWVPFIHLGV